MADETPKTMRPRWWRILRRILIGLGVTGALLALLGVLLYRFGGMSGSVHPETFRQYDAMVAAGRAPAIRGRFVIPIPGCQCHSTDPVLTAQHSVRRMSECNRCHDTSPPHMEPGVE